MKTSQEVVGILITILLGLAILPGCGLVRKSEVKKSFTDVCNGIDTMETNIDNCSYISSDVRTFIDALRKKCKEIAGEFQ